MRFLKTAQLRFLALLATLWLGVFFLTRSALLINNLDDAKPTLGSLLRIFAEGLVYDLIFLLYALAPIALYLLLCPAHLWRQRWQLRVLQIAMTLGVFIILFTVAAEWLFWDEFGVRFNFIAVDYLVYSDEVLNNILESYPVYPLVAALAVIAVVITVLQRRRLRRISEAPLLNWRQRGITMLAAAALMGLAFQGIGQDFPRRSGGNAYQHELAANGPYQFFAAFRNNELDYNQFYLVLPEANVASSLREEVSEPNTHYLDNDPLSIRREIDSPGDSHKLNLILVTIESLSAKFLGSEGDTRGLSPNLDALRQQSLYFNQFYATGTRTDRGLEAISLSIPPTPGRSIVKRIGRETGFASLGQQLSAQGYDSVFVYGGRGYFGNMNAFFTGNGYRTVDQTDVQDEDIVFTNAWGMSDEDLYTQTLQLADANAAIGKPFFLQLMTTSNHRPFSYPEGRIDIPSGTGRAGAVKYTDYAIGQFLAQAREKPWFLDTLFVFVADHAAGSAGMEDLPIQNYHIPMFIYAPGLIQPQENATIASQIDIAPTVLGLLNMDYTSTFFGRNLLHPDPGPGRALIGNYQHLGLFDGQDLAILSPRRLARLHDDALRLSIERPTQAEDPLVSRGIAYYQGASYAYSHDLLNWRPLQGDKRITLR